MRTGLDGQAPWARVTSGQAAALAALADWGIAVSKKDTIIVDEGTYQTSRPGVFAAGDVQTGLRIAIEAVAGGIEAQTERALENLMAILREAKLGPENVVKTTLFLADMADFSAVNAVYGRYFAKEAPARSTFQVAGLPRNARIEIELIAAF